MIHIAVISSGDSAGDNLVSKMRLVAHDKGLKYEIKALPANNIDQLTGEESVVWLAPNARYQEEEVRKFCEEKGSKFGIIEPFIFSSMNGEGLLEKTLALLE